MSGVDVSLPVAPLSPEQLRADHHGFLNAINVVHSELQLLERMLSERGIFRTEIQLCERAIATVRRSASPEERGSVTEIARPIMGRVVSELNNHPVSDPTTSDDVRHAVRVIGEVIDQVEMRYQHARARMTLRGTYAPRSAAEVVAETRDALDMTDAFNRLAGFSSNGSDRAGLTVDPPAAHNHVAAVLSQLAWGLLRGAILRTAADSSISAQFTIAEKSSTVTVADHGEPLTLTATKTQEPGSEEDAPYAAVYRSVYYTAYQYGGRMTIDSTPTGQTILRVTLPADEEAS